MYGPHSRRRFLQSGAGAGALAALGQLPLVSKLAPVSAAEAVLDPDVVRLHPEIAPTVRLLEETPRDRLLEVFAERIRKGLSYREVLAALQLAGVKNVEPRPSVGYKFHTVLVVNSAHLASLSSPPEHRWLPIFWALDYYKSAAARDVQERGDWTMRPVEESAVPPAGQAEAAFIAAMDRWDEAAADAAIAGLVRTAGANRTYEILFRYGMRDFRSIGHKAIFVANSLRTLQTIGWHHAEPILRSLAYALLMHEGSNPAKRDAEADRPYRRNQDLATKIRKDWRGGEVTPEATTELVETLRTASSDQACDLVVTLLNRGVSPQSVWDAFYVAAGEMLMRQPGIVALHAVTTTNATSYAFRTSGNDRTRRLLMLQTAAFLPMFREAMQSRGRIQDVFINDLKAEPAKELSKAESVEAIFAQVHGEPMAAAENMLAYLGQSGSAKELMDAARALVFIKGDNAHDYKFSSAVLEDYYQISPAWRDLYLATSVFKLRGSAEQDNALAERARAALS